MRLPKLPALIVGSVLAFIFLIGGFFVIQGLPGRAVDEQPRDVVVADITSNSGKISYATAARTQGVVEYGVSPTALNLLAPESEAGTDHEVELTLLSKDTTYYFQIAIGGDKYDNAGVPWTFRTKASDTDLDNLELSPTTLPTPVSRVVVPHTESFCNETNCEQIKQKLGQGCTTQDYVKCIKKVAPTQKPLTTP
ncbi:hypothetical protein A2963_02670 [Candidatus Roizmanbacteria bacterium RIFCSPLOWO2_01_FULL_40_13]|nr:MAG: hypothetical protein A2963_02670 [Candidatus Roizmanbacteria bacterium RIFCSPLOWO2_01_FULL_40_13]